MIQICARIIGGKQFEAKDALEKLGMECTIATHVKSVPCAKPTRRKKFEDRVTPIMPYVRVTCEEAQFHEVKTNKFVVDLWAMNTHDLASFLDFEKRAAMGEWDANGPLGHLRPGEIMQILGGPFAGMHLSFEKVRDSRVRGSVDFMGKGTTVEVPLDDLNWKDAG